jgi:hypothetical protein
MSSISKTDRLLQVLRTTSATARAPAGGRRPPAKGAAGGAPSPRFDLAADVVRRVSAIAADAEHRAELVEQAFLESCVAQAFGSQAVTDPTFRQMITRTREAIRDSAELSAAMGRLVRELGAPRD